MPAVSTVSTSTWYFTKHLYTVHARLSDYPSIYQAFMILPNSPVYSKSMELWFNKGDIILEAEDTLFRTFSSVLSRESIVFRKMLTLLDSSNAETFEDCPLIHLSDSVLDLTYFLRAIHDTRFYDIDQIHDFFVLAGVLRLSTKYDVAYLRGRSIKVFSSLFPPILEEFEASLIAKSYIPTFTGRNFAAVNLARECNVTTVLPVALFRCCTGMNVVEILDGAFGKDNVCHHALDWQDKRLCLIARAVLETRARKYTMGFLLGSSPDPLSTSCLSKGTCDSVRLRFLRNVELTNANYGKVNPLLTGFRWDQFQKEICSACYRSARQSFEREKAALWEDLPTIFQLGNWSNLRAQMEDGDSDSIKPCSMSSGDSSATAV